MVTVLHLIESFKEYQVLLLTGWKAPRERIARLTGLTPNQINYMVFRARHGNRRKYKLDGKLRPETIRRKRWP